MSITFLYEFHVAAFVNVFHFIYEINNKTIMLLGRWLTDIDYNCHYIMEETDW